MRVLKEKSDDYKNVFTAKNIAAVKVRCLLQSAITTVDKLPRSIALPYYASLDTIYNLFDNMSYKRAYQEICSFDYRLRHNDDLSNKETADYIHKMTQLIYKANLLTDS